MFYQLLFFLLLAVSATFLGCKKTSDPIVFDPVPFIELKSTTPTTIKAYSDSLMFRLFYKDGDGDLGSANAEDFNLFIEDSRIQLVHSFRIPLVGPEGVNVPIQGHFEIPFKGVVLTNENAESEKVTFKIHLKDRAGNASNTVVSPEITVTR